MKKRILTFLKLSALFACVIITSFFSGGVGFLFTREFVSDNDNPEDVVRRITNDVKVVNEESAIIDVAEKSNGSVVSIVIEKEVPIYDYDLFDEFGYLSPRRIPGGTKERQIGSGTGFVVSEDGLLITNKHVASDLDAKYTVIFPDGREYKASVLAQDTLLDIAFMQINSNETFDPLPLGSSSDIRVGQRVVAIGNALGEFSNTVSTGIVSGLSRDIIASDANGSNPSSINNVIQTDASINFGNSGGPLLDIEGNVIGVNVAVATDAENIGFAIPIDVVKDLLQRYTETGSIDRPVLGIVYISVTESVKEEYDLDVSYGALIIENENGESGVLDGSPAQKAGLKEGDVILEVDGKKIDNIENTVFEIIQNKRIGDSVELVVLRDGKTIKFEILLEKFEL